MTPGCPCQRRDRISRGHQEGPYTDRTACGRSHSASLLFLFPRLLFSELLSEYSTKDEIAQTRRRHAASLRQICVLHRPKVWRHRTPLIWRQFPVVRMRLYVNETHSLVSELLDCQNWWLLDPTISPVSIRFHLKPSIRTLFLC